MLVSVVLPSYNHKQYVLEAIESVLSQDWPEIELVVIDDGSTDGSPDLLRDYHEERGGFRLKVRENRGVIATLNEGVALSRGEAVCILASDDYLPAKSISSRAKALLKNPHLVAVFGDGIKIGEDGVTTSSLVDEKRRSVFVQSDPVPSFLRGVNLPIHTMLARVKSLEEIGGFDKRYRYCEDLDVQLLLFLKGQVGWVSSPSYCYRRHESNVTRTNRQVARADKVLCFRKYLEEIPELKPYHSIVKKQLRRHYLRLARYLRQKGGGEQWERKILQRGWDFAYRDPRLLLNLVRLRISNN